MALPPWRQQLCTEAGKPSLDLDETPKLFFMANGLLLAPTWAPKAKKVALCLNLDGKTLPICSKQVLLGFWFEFVQTLPPLTTLLWANIQRTFIAGFFVLLKSYLGISCVVPTTSLECGGLSSLVHKSTICSIYSFARHIQPFASIWLHGLTVKRLHYLES